MCAEVPLRVLFAVLLLAAWGAGDQANRLVTFPPEWERSLRRGVAGCLVCTVSVRCALQVPIGSPGPPAWWEMNHLQSKALHGGLQSPLPVLSPPHILLFASWRCDIGNSWVFPLQGVPQKCWRPSPASRQTAWAWAQVKELQSLPSPEVCSSPLTCWGCAQDRMMLMLSAKERLKIFPAAILAHSGPPSLLTPCHAQRGCLKKKPCHRWAGKRSTLSASEGAHVL